MKNFNYLWLWHEFWLDLKNFLTRKNYGRLVWKIPKGLRFKWSGMAVKGAWALVVWKIVGSSFERRDVSCASRSTKNFAIKERYTALLHAYFRKVLKNHTKNKIIKKWHFLVSNTLLTTYSRHSNKFFKILTNLRTYLSVIKFPSKLYPDKSPPIVQIKALRAVTVRPLVFFSSRCASSPFAASTFAPSTSACREHWPFIIPIHSSSLSLPLRDHLNFTSLSIPAHSRRQPFAIRYSHPPAAHSFILVFTRPRVRVPTVYREIDSSLFPL